MVKSPEYTVLRRYTDGTYKLVHLTDLFRSLFQYAIARQEPDVAYVRLAKLEGGHRIAHATLRAVNRG